MIGIIYKICNNINDKIYIGKTYSSIDRRFKQHIADSHKLRCENRPLYRAMNKYGVENFYIVEIGKFENLEEMEIVYINKYDSYNNGYNATLGGDGKRYINTSDVDIINKYNELMDVRKTAKYFGYCSDTIRTILKNNNIKITRNFNTPKVICIELNIEFKNVSNAADYFIENNIAKTKNRDSIRRGILRALDGTLNGYCGYTFEKVM